MKVRSHEDMIYLDASGAEIPALYRAYLEMFGQHDGATQDVFFAVANRFPTWEDKFHISDASTVAYALEDAGMIKTARYIFTTVDAIYNEDPIYDEEEYV